jgi:ribosomal protein S18 acetylase RimI-like enzyme
MPPPDQAPAAVAATPGPRAERPQDVLPRLAANLAAVGARDRLTVEIWPFRAFLSPGPGDDMMSFAVPLATDADWGAGVGPLREAFLSRGRAPRVEHFAELQPGLAEALERAGLRRLSAQQAMIATPASLKRRRLPEGLGVRFLDPGRPDLVAALMALQQAAFALPESARTDADWQAFLERTLADGSLLAAMVTAEGADGRTAAGADGAASAAAGDRPASDAAVACVGLQIGADAAEVSGVATRPGWRRRGLASALCGRALARFFQQGYDLAWLSAADPVAGAVYRRIGFRPVGTLLTYGVRRDEAAVP